MPKLIYFPAQGRAQAIRFMLAAKKVEFEDQRISHTRWWPIKEAGTFGTGSQLPVYIQDDGTYYTQSMAILKMLAFEHGYMPTTAKCHYEVTWMEGVIQDMGIMQKPERFALLRNDADASARELVIDILEKFI